MITKNDVLAPSRQSVTKNYEPNKENNINSSIDYLITYLKFIEFYLVYFHWFVKQGQLINRSASQITLYTKPSTFILYWKYLRVSYEHSWSYVSSCKIHSKQWNSLWNAFRRNCISHNMHHRLIKSSIQWVFCEPLKLQILSLKLKNRFFRVI